jgi:hypothetical protein
MTNDDGYERWGELMQCAWIWKDRAFTTQKAALFASDPFANLRGGSVGFCAVGGGGGGARSFRAGMIG